MRYTITILKRALKELESLPAIASKRIIKAIDLLASDTRPAGCKKLKGEKETTWRIRVGLQSIICYRRYGKNSRDKKNSRP